MSSRPTLVHVAASRGRGRELLKQLARQLVPRGQSFPLTVSLVAHLGLVGIAARHARTVVSAGSATAAIELSAPDIERPEDSAPEQPAPESVALSVHTAVHQTSTAHVASAQPTAASTGRTAEAPVLAPNVMVSAVDAGPRFVMTVAPTNALRSGLTSANGVATGNALAPAAPIAEAATETPARLKLGNAPAYTAAALSAGVEADVPLEIVVDEAGAVASARGAEHVGYGLDEAAIQSVRGYRFIPAQRGGKPVAVRMRWLMRFQLR